jgi:peptide/nickel transport system ATP-binding protein
MKSLLELERLSVTFQTERGVLQAISDVTFNIRTGEVVCLVGESGSGKTVTSKAIMRLIDEENGRITGGSIHLDGMDIEGLSAYELRKLRGKKVAMIFQEPMSAFDPVFTVGSQIVETIRRHDGQCSSSAAWRRGVELLKRVGIPEPELRMKQYPGELSGGMLQRAMIAMALSCGPELLIADEPTTALDVTIQAQILKLLEELKDEFQMSILLITHDLGIAAELADRIVVMYAGQVVEQAGAAELFKQPYHPYTEGLLRSITTIDSDKAKRLYTIPGAIPSLTELPEGCRFHPRCPYASDKCSREAPDLTGSGSRLAACWHVDRVLNGQTVTGPGSTDSQAWNRGLVVRQEAEAHVLSIRNKEETPLFELRQLSKHYPYGSQLFRRQRQVIHALDNVSLKLPKGETFGLVGESGSGKSTLGRVLLHLEKPTSGEVLFEGRDLASLKGSQLRQERRYMQMIFQDPYGSVDPRWKIGEIIGEPFAVHAKLRTRERKEAVEELLRLVGLPASAYDRYPHEFSGGQRQRIGIARAIALRPKFVLADEAVSALDVSVQAQIINLLQELGHGLELTLLFIGHGLNVVRYVSDRIGVMYLGKLVEIAPSEELFRHPAHHYTMGLIASIPIADPQRRRAFTSIQGEIPSPANPPSGCRFRTRCPAATARCAAEEPVFREVGAGHWVACHDPVM